MEPFRCGAESRRLSTRAEAVSPVVSDVSSRSRGPIEHPGQHPCRPWRSSRKRGSCADWSARWRNSPPTASRSNWWTSPVIGLAVLQRPKRRGASNFEPVVDALVDIRAHDWVRAVEHAHEVLTLVHKLSGTDQHLQNPTHRQAEKRSSPRNGDATRASSSEIWSVMCANKVNYVYKLKIKAWKCRKAHVTPKTSASAYKL